jgi:hypothetical protein
MKRKKNIKEANADSKKRKRNTKSDKQVQGSQVEDSQYLSKINVT